jgi:LDH2 family malate/lactate/ureidoglycolate dehydrogenase
LDAQERVKVDWRRLRALARAIFLGAGLPDGEAEIIADSLVAANLAGVHSHGVSRIRDYLERMERDLVTRVTKIDVVRETATTALLDANNGWGQVASQRAVEVVVGKARDFGSAWVGVRNSNHYGTAAYWTSRIASEGMVGISSTNASPVMAPFGSRRASLGTNPIFHEKALFVKPTWRPPRGGCATASLPFARYASIRTLLSESTLW